MSNKDVQSTPPTTGKMSTKLLILAMLAVVVVIIYMIFREQLTLEALAEQETLLRQFQDDHPVLVYVIAFFIYVSVTGLSLPGAAALSLAYGWYFGWIRGVILVSFASTAGATVAFLLSRYLFRDALQSRFKAQLTAFNRALEREGAFYLFTLRLIPAVPFFVVNVVMGLTRIRTATFWWVSQVGMLAGTVAYLYAGSTVPSLAHLADPSQLRINDIRDWPKLVEELRSGARNDAKGPAKHIWGQFSSEAQAAVTLAPSGQLNSESKARIVTGINDLMSKPEFALNADWREAVRADEKDLKERRAAIKRLTKANRAILVAAFPDVILPPQPILSKQLIAAFAILGVFPLVVKKIVQRFRKGPIGDEPSTERDSTVNTSEGDESSPNAIS